LLPTTFLARLLSEKIPAPANGFHPNAIDFNGSSSGCKVTPGSDHRDEDICGNVLDEDSFVFVDHPDVPFAAEVSSVNYSKVHNIVVKAEAVVETS
jgi:hypothetical protein